MPSITRRNLLEGVAGVAALCVVGGVVRIVGDGTLLRPPGGQDEARFDGNCLRCDRCRSICPQGCISVAVLETGLINMRTPRLDFRKGYCDFCDKCIEVCPTPALVAFDEYQEKLGVAVIDTDMCLAYRSTGCKTCYEVCPFGAVSLTESYTPVIDTQICNGCGMCEYKCPASSFGYYDGSSNRGVNILTLEEADEA